MLSNKTIYNRIATVFPWFCVFILICVGYFIESSLIYKIFNLLFVIIIIIVLLKYYVLRNRVIENGNQHIISDNNEMHQLYEDSCETSDNQIKDFNSSFENSSLEEISLQDKKIANQNDNVDQKFLNSVNAVIGLIKEYYPAMNVAVYWYNEVNKSFKILSVKSELSDVFSQRFDLGQDIISHTCKNKKSVLLNINDNELNKDLLLDFYQLSNGIKSVICTPILLDNEVIGALLCDSGIDNFYGEPNLESLQIFSSIIAYYIKYFSVEDEFSFDKYVLGVLTDKKMFTENELFDLIHKCVNRYVDYISMALVLNNNEKYFVKKNFHIK